MLFVLRRAKKLVDGGNYFYQIPSSKRLVMPKIYSLMREGHDIVFEKTDEDTVLLALLRKMDKQPRDVAMLNRVIRNGGLIDYIKLLEDKYAAASASQVSQL